MKRIKTGNGKKGRRETEKTETGDWRRETGKIGE